MQYRNSVSVDLTSSQGRWVKCEAEANDADLQGWAAEHEIDLAFATTFQRFILMRCIVEQMLLADLSARKAMPIEQLGEAIAANTELRDKVATAVKVKAQPPAAVA